MTCTACDEELPPDAILCLFCRDFKIPREDPRRIQFIDKVKAIRSGLMPSLPAGPGRWSARSTHTLLFGFIGAIFLSLGLVYSASPSIRGIMSIFGLLFFFSFLIFLLLDLMGVPPNSRFTPKRGMTAFLDGLTRKLFLRSYFCLSIIDRTSMPRTTPLLETLPGHAGRSGFESAQAFTRYWRTLLGTGRSLRYHLTKQEMIGDRCAVISLDIRIRGLNTMATSIAVGGVVGLLLAQKQECLEVKKLVLERDGLWWIVNGELDDTEDRALEAFFRADRDAGQWTGVDS